MAPVLSEFTWEVGAGSTVLLGPNGAGKSTLLAIGADALRPRSGRVSFNGLSPRSFRDRLRYRQCVGWVPQFARSVPGLTVREQVAYAGWLKGLTSEEAWKTALDALAEVGLVDRANDRASRLSGGQLRRVGLAQALVHNPEVLLLDEPTAGLDPAQRSRFRELLSTLPVSRTMIISTHQVDDLHELFDWVVVIIEGTIRFTGSVEEFMRLAPPGDEFPAESAYRRLAGG